MNEQARRWDLSYRGEAPPWDIGRPQPAVVRLADAGAFESAVLDAGCGTGENAIELAARGFAVWGVDWSPLAIQAARAKASARGLDVTFAVADALDLSALGRQFDRILDCGLFHTFDDEQRAQYVASLAAALVPSGRLFVLCFSDEEPWDGGPRRVTRAELEHAFATGWSLRSIVPERFATRLHDAGARAWLATVDRLPAV